MPLFSGLAPLLPSLMRMMLSSSQFQASSSSVLLYLYCLHKGRSVSASLVKFLLSHSEREEQLETTTRLVAQLEPFHVHVVRDAVSRGLRDNSEQGKVVLLRNLTTLSARENWAAVVRSSHLQLAELLPCPGLTQLVLQLLRLVPPGLNTRVVTVYKVAQAVVEVVLETVAGQMEFAEKVSRVAVCEEILGVLCAVRCGLQLTLRFLLDASLSSRFCLYLGGSLGPEESLSPRQQQAVSLLEANYK